MPDSETISLGYACDALEEQARLFHNDCNRKGIKEMTIRQWCESFISWLDPYKFEQEYIETQRWLKECDEREAARDKCPDNARRMPVK